jgi:hypothetical protein
MEVKDWICDLSNSSDVKNKPQYRWAISAIYCPKASPVLEFESFYRIRAKRRVVQLTHNALKNRVGRSLYLSSAYKVRGRCSREMCDYASVCSANSSASSISIPR